MMETKWYHGVKWKLIERRTIDGELWLQVANGAWDTTHNGAKNAIADDRYSAMSEDERLQQGRLLAAAPETATQRDSLLSVQKRLVEALEGIRHVHSTRAGATGSLWRLEQIDDIARAAILAAKASS